MDFNVRRDFFMKRRHNMEPPDYHEDKDPARASGFFKKRLTVDWMIVIAIFVFLGGVLGGILFCGHYAHDPLASGSVPWRRHLSRVKSSGLKWKQETIPHLN